MFSSEEEKKGIFEQGVKMNFEETLKAQRIIITIALILMSLVSFNFALKGTYTIIALIVGFAFLGMAFFLLFRLKKI
jgi:heme O synthase-like polyprenyltransferase